jgi:anti-sigma regulatory factor (Ser/Thr protein kinase)
LGLPRKVIEHLPLHPSAARLARTQVRSLCGGLRVETREDAILLTSEVVTNAVQHAAGPIILTVIRRGGDLRVEVQDATSSSPSVSRRGALAEGGRGLALLAALSSEWGTTSSHPHSTGKTVWFEINDASIP